MYQDEKLICEDCGKEFDFTAGEQEFYAEKGLTNKPKRCPECRKRWIPGSLQWTYPGSHPPGQDH